MKREITEKQKNTKHSYKKYLANFWSDVVEMTEDYINQGIVIDLYLFQIYID